MTLLDAPPYDAGRERLVRNIILSAIAAIIVAAVLAWVFRYWPQQHRLNQFLTTVESGDLNKAYGEWNHDPDWQQHADRYKGYSFADFSKDWGPSSDFGKIRSHRIELTTKIGNGVVMAVDVNGGKTPIFLRVDYKTKTIGFSPVELYVGPS